MRVLFCPIFAERSQAGERFQISLATGCCFAGDDVVNVANWKAFYIDVS